MAVVFKHKPIQYTTVTVSATEAETEINNIASRRYEWKEGYLKLGGRYVLDHVVHGSPLLFVFVLETWRR